MDIFCGSLPVSSQYIVCLDTVVNTGVSLDLSLRLYLNGSLGWSMCALLMPSTCGGMNSATLLHKHAACLEDTE